MKYEAIINNYQLGIVIQRFSDYIYSTEKLNSHSHRVVFKVNRFSLTKLKSAGIGLADRLKEVK